MAQLTWQRGDGAPRVVVTKSLESGEEEKVPSHHIIGGELRGSRDGSQRRSSMDMAVVGFCRLNAVRTKQQDRGMPHSRIDLPLVRSSVRLADPCPSSWGKMVVDCKQAAVTRRGLGGAEQSDKARGDAPL